MQALLQVIPAEDVAFVPATKEIVVSIRGDETIGVVLGTLQDRLAAEDGGEITIRSTAMHTRSKTTPGSSSHNSFVLGSMGSEAAAS